MKQQTTDECTKKIRTNAHKPALTAKLVPQIMATSKSNARAAQMPSSSFFACSSLFVANIMWEAISTGSIIFVEGKSNGSNISSSLRLSMLLRSNLFAVPDGVAVVALSSRVGGFDVGGETEKRRVDEPKVAVPRG